MKLARTIAAVLLLITMLAMTAIGAIRTSDLYLRVFTEAWEFWVASLVCGVVGVLIVPRDS